MHSPRSAIPLAIVMLLGSGPAWAAPRVGVPAPVADCPTQKVCVWETPAWRGPATVADRADVCVDRRIESVKNDASYGGRIGTYLLLWKAPGCQGERDAVVFGGESEPLVDARSYSVRGEV